MKTLVNKANPAIRITALEIEVQEESEMYLIPVSDYCIPMYIPDWTLVEGIKGNLEEIPSNVDLEEEIEKAQEHYFALKDKGFSLDSMDVSVLARHFYELGRYERINGNTGFEAGKERAFEQFSDILDKWEAHAIEGMKAGAYAYHHGKIALICDLRDWIKEQTKGGNK